SRRTSATTFERLREDTMPTIIGISGSLRRGSYNAALLRSAVDLAPAGIAIGTATLGDIPLYGSSLYVAHAPKVFDAEGRIVDEAVRATVAKHLTGFAAFIARVGRGS